MVEKGLGSDESRSDGW